MLTQLFDLFLLNKDLHFSFKNSVTVFDGILDARVYKIHPNFSRANQEKQNKVLTLNVIKLI